MTGEQRIVARAVDEWMLSPVTSLIVGWMMPRVGELMGALGVERVDEIVGESRPPAVTDATTAGLLDQP